MPHLTYAKDFQGVADVFLRSPAIYKPLLEFIENVMVGPSDLSKPEREILAAHVSSLNGCDFCLGAHRATLAAMDTGAEVIDSLEHGSKMEGVSDQLRAILDFATKLTRDPGGIGKADIDALITEGIAEQTIEDAINVISLFNYVNRLVDSFGVEGGPSYFEYVGTALANHGYTPLLESSETKAR